MLLNYRRGEILDRHGTSLLGGEEEKLLVVFPALLKDDDAAAAKMVCQRFPKAAAAGNPFVALRDVDAREEITFKNLQTPGLLVVPPGKGTAAGLWLHMWPGIPGPMMERAKLAWN